MGGLSPPAPKGVQTALAVAGHRELPGEFRDPPLADPGALLRVGGPQHMEIPATQGVLPGVLRLHHRQAGPAQQRPDRLLLPGLLPHGTGVVEDHCPLPRDDIPLPEPGGQDGPDGAHLKPRQLPQLDHAVGTGGIHPLHPAPLQQTDQPVPPPVEFFRLQIPSGLSATAGGQPHPRLLPPEDIQRPLQKGGVHVHQGTAGPEDRPTAVHPHERPAEGDRLMEPHPQPARLIHRCRSPGRRHLSAPAGRCRSPWRSRRRCSGRRYTAGR